MRVKTNRRNEMKKYIALLVVLSVGAAHAGIVSLGSDWTEYGPYSVVNNETATGYYVEMPRTNSANANKSMYQTVSGGDFASTALNVGETVNMSFTVTTYGGNGPQTGDLGFRFGLWDEGTGASISSRLDWNNPAGNTMRIGHRSSGASATAIGSQSASVFGTDIPTDITDTGLEGWSKKNDSEDVTLSLTRTGASDYTAFVTWGDATLVYTNGISGMTLDSIDGVGFRLQTAAFQNQGYTLSNLSVDVIPEPATMGLLGLFGGGLLVIRRMFKV
jgi:hypothetical protein